MDALRIAHRVVGLVRLDHVASVLRGAAEVSAANRVEWWRWTAWLALGITLRRIGAA